MVSYQIGKVFTLVSVQDCMDRIAAEKEQLEADIEEKSSKISRISEDMDKLKVILYGKFGKSINLEK